VAATTGSVYHAKGRPDLTFKINLVRVPVLALAIWIGSRWGINGVAFAFMAVALTWTFVSATWTARLLRMRRRDIYFAMAPAVTASAGMIAGLWGLRMTIFSDFSDLRMLSALVVSGALLYFGLLSAFWRSTLIDMAGLMRHLRQQPVR
jgi:PST family polysaccharide transporter